MSKERKPRYTVCTIITSDINLVVDSDNIRSLGKTHEDIYREGLQVIREMNANKLPK